MFLLFYFLRLAIVIVTHADEISRDVLAGSPQKVTVRTDIQRDSSTMFPVNETWVLGVPATLDERV